MLRSYLLPLTAAVALAACASEPSPDTPAADAGTVTAPPAAPPVVGPAVRGDTVETAAGEPVLIDVLANDQGAGLQIGAFTTATPNGGSVIRTTDERLYYTPAAGYSGSDVFGYNVTDANGLSAEGRVTVNVR